MLRFHALKIDSNNTSLYQPAQSTLPRFLLLQSVCANFSSGGSTVKVSCLENR